MPRRSGAVPVDADAAHEHFLDAAEACFERYGVNKTTMEDIAKIAGVSRPTVYRHFPDRDSLILAVVMRRSRALIEKAQKYIRRQKSFEDQMVEGLLYLVNTGRKDPFIRILVSPEHMDLATQLLGASEAVVDLTYQMWAPILEESVERGDLDPGLDHREIARWITYVQLVLVGRFDIAPEDTAGHRKMLRRFFWPAFAKTPATARA